MQFHATYITTSKTFIGTSDFNFLPRIGETLSFNGLVNYRILDIIYSLHNGSFNKVNVTIILDLKI